MRTRDRIKYFFIDNKGKFIFAAILSIAIILLYTVLNNSWKNIIAYCDILFLTSGVLLCVAGFSFVNYHGFFDMFAFSFSKKKRKEMGEDYYQYSERKNLERKSNKLAPVPYLLVSLLLLIVSIILYIVIANNL